MRRSLRGRSLSKCIAASSAPAWPTQKVRLLVPRFVPSLVNTRARPIETHALLVDLLKTLKRLTGLSLHEMPQVMQRATNLVRVFKSYAAEQGADDARVYLRELSKLFEIVQEGISAYLFGGQSPDFAAVAADRRARAEAEFREVTQNYEEAAGNWLDQKQREDARVKAEQERMSAELRQREQELIDKHYGGRTPPQASPLVESSSSRLSLPESSNSRLSLADSTSSRLSVAAPGTRSPSIVSPVSPFAPAGVAAEPRRAPERRTSEGSVSRAHIGAMSYRSSNDLLRGSSSSVTDAVLQAKLAEEAGIVGKKAAPRRSVTSGSLWGLDSQQQQVVVQSTFGSIPALNAPTLEQSEENVYDPPESEQLRRLIQQQQQHQQQHQRVSPVSSTDSLASNSSGSSRRGVVPIMPIVGTAPAPIQSLDVVVTYRNMSRSGSLMSINGNVAMPVPVMREQMEAAEIDYFQQQMQMREYSNTVRQQQMQQDAQVQYELNLQRQREIELAQLYAAPPADDGAVSAALEKQRLAEAEAARTLEAIQEEAVEEEPKVRAYFLPFLCLRVCV